MSHLQPPTGLGRRRRRLSDEETAQRMLRTAAAMVHRTGLTVSLDHIGLEDVIRDADVSRSAVYRRWPYKDLFISDLVKQLAATATPTIVTDELAMIRQIAANHLDWLETSELRDGLVMELFRQLSLLDFQTLYESAGWRTYLALHATFMSLADGELREEVGLALAQSEREHRARVAQAWEQLAGLLGYRLRPESGVTFDIVAMLLDAAIRGLVIMALSTPGIATHRVQARPAGAVSADEWSVPALGMVGVASAFLEPDPAVEWDSERIARVGQALTGLTAP
jgi:AcrR family transcriptional regulator